MVTLYTTFTIYAATVSFISGYVSAVRLFIKLNSDYSLSGKNNANFF